MVCFLQSADCKTGDLCCQRIRDDLADDGANNPHVANVRKLAAEEGSEVFVICAQIEQEIAELDDDEKAMFLEDLD